MVTVNNSDKATYTDSEIRHAVLNWLSESVGFNIPPDTA